MISTLVFLVIVLLILILIFCNKRPNIAVKRLELIEKLDKKIFFNPFIRYSLVNALKLNLNAFITLKAYTTNNTGEKATAIVILTLINLVPIILARLLFKRKDKLEDEVNFSRYNTIYKGKRVDNEKNHHVWLFPIAFFYRRTIFICAMVYLFEWPYLQMVVH